MKKNNSHPKPSRRNLVNTQRCDRETRIKFFPGHVAQATDVHEQVTKDAPSIQEGKEASGHTTGHH
ncbi:hypothetical protein [Arthrobacter globiformis]|uniref:hypothetical protein n=1 Tax=Arthrobacter globiformis TaxID=1665 RepID=UPI0027932947|nr:hypothetical protein [Arthrobacter globiformis]MDQ0618261.1 hypothetical protein [Arthrobacter globiformis]